MPFEMPPAITLLQVAAPTQVQIPRVDIAIEVVGNLRLELKLQDATRLLARRAAAPSVNRRYPPTILELIRLVKPNPQRPRDKQWDSIGAVSLRFNPDSRLVTVEYCVAQCGHDPQTAAFERGRKMVVYHALESQVVKRLDRKLADLQKYADR